MSAVTTFLECLGSTFWAGGLLGRTLRWSSLFFVPPVWPTCNGCSKVVCPARCWCISESKDLHPLQSHLGSQGDPLSRCSRGLALERPLSDPGPVSTEDLQRLANPEHARRRLQCNLGPRNWPEQASVSPSRRCWRSARPGLPNSTSRPCRGCKSPCRQPMVRFHSSACPT